MPDQPSSPRRFDLLAILSEARYRRIVSAMVSGGAARMLSSGVALISLPLTVRYLGPERYGVWATVTSVAAWVNLLDLGIGNSLTNLVSRAYANRDRSEAARAITNALVLTSAAALLAGGVFLYCWRRVDWVRLLNAAPEYSPEVRWTILIAATLMLAALPINLVGKVFAGFQELQVYNKGLMIGILGSLAGLVLGTVLRVSMPVLFLLCFGSINAVTCLALVWLVIWNKPWLRPKLSLLSARTARGLLDSGWSFLLIQMAAVVVFSSDNIVVSHYLGVAEVTPYSVTWRLVGCGAVFQSLLFPALWPAYAEAHARGDAAWIRRTFRVSMRASLILNIGWAIMLAGIGPILIRWWAGAAAVPAYPLLLAMASWSILSGFMTVQSCLLGALNRTRMQAILSVFAAIVNVAISIVLVTRAGSLGVILGTILSYIVVLVGPQTMMVSNALRELSSPSNEVRDVSLAVISEAAS